MLARVMLGVLRSASLVPVPRDRRQNSGCERCMRLQSPAESDGLGRRFERNDDISRQGAAGSAGVHSPTLNYAAAARFVALAARAFARFATSAAFLAGDILFIAAFAGGALTAAFLTTAFFASAFFSAHLFFRAATMLALPAALSLCLALAGAGAVTGAGASVSPRTFAHRRCWASFMRRIASGENFRRFLSGAGSVVPTAAVSVAPLASSVRRSAI
jgi:hypothetical protein